MSKLELNETALTLLIHPGVTSANCCDLFHWFKMVAICMNIFVTSKIQQTTVLKTNSSGLDTTLNHRPSHLYLENK